MCCPIISYPVVQTTKRRDQVIYDTADRFGLKLYSSPSHLREDQSPAFESFGDPSLAHESWWPLSHWSKSWQPRLTLTCSRVCIKGQMNTYLVSRLGSNLITIANKINNLHALIWRFAFPLFVFMLTHTHLTDANPDAKAHWRGSLIFEGQTLVNERLGPVSIDSSNYSY